MKLEDKRGRLKAVRRLMMLDGDEIRNNLGQNSTPFKENCRLSTREMRSEGKGPGARAG